VAMIRFGAQNDKLNSDIVLNMMFILFCLYIWPWSYYSRNWLRLN